MQTNERPTMPPSSEDTRALEWSRFLARIEDASRGPSSSGLLRSLALAWCAETNARETG